MTETNTQTTPEAVQQTAPAAPQFDMERLEAKNRLYARQLDFYSPEAVAASPVTIVGAGGLGSLFAQVARKSGFTTFTIYDSDTLELHNLSNQGYNASHLGKTKGEALASLIRDWMPESVSPATVEFIPKFVVLNTLFKTPIVVSCVDSMEARRDIWQAFEGSRDARILVDLRMGAWSYEWHIVDKTQPQTVEWYKATLPETTNPVEDLPCTGRAVYTTGIACASSACAALINYVFNKKIGQAVVSMHGDLLNFLVYQKKTVNVNVDTSTST